MALDMIDAIRSAEDAAAETRKRAQDSSREILQKAREDARTHNVVSVITAGNEASIRLHERFGFTFCGTVPEVGAKFGRLLDIDHYSLIV